MEKTEKVIIFVIQIRAKNTVNMKKLKNLIRLSSKVAIYVPSTVNVNEQTDNKAQVDSALILMSTLFGGATAAEALGAWVSDVEGLVRERVTVVYSHATTEQLNANIDAVIDFCESLKIEMSQEAIALEVNGELYFV